MIEIIHIKLVAIKFAAFHFMQLICPEMCFQYVHVVYRPIKLIFIFSLISGTLPL